MRVLEGLIGKKGKDQKGPPKVLNVLAQAFARRAPLNKATACTTPFEGIDEKQVEGKILEVKPDEKVNPFAGLFAGLKRTPSVNVEETPKKVEEIDWLSGLLEKKSDGEIPKEALSAVAGLLGKGIGGKTDSQVVNAIATLMVKKEETGKDTLNILAGLFGKKAGE